LVESAEVFPESAETVDVDRLVSGDGSDNEESDGFSKGIDEAGYGGG